LKRTHDPLRLNDHGDKLSRLSGPRSPSCASKSPSWAPKTGLLNRLVDIAALRWLPMRRARSWTASMGRWCKRAGWR